MFFSAFYLIDIGSIIHTVFPFYTSGYRSFQELEQLLPDHNRYRFSCFWTFKVLLIKPPIYLKWRREGKENPSKNHPCTPHGFGQISAFLELITLHSLHSEMDENLSRDTNRKALRQHWSHRHHLLNSSCAGNCSPPE